MFDISADDYELAEAALAATNTQPGDSLAPAFRILRDECGWTLIKSKRVCDLVLAVRSRGG